MPSWVVVIGKDSKGGAKFGQRGPYTHFRAEQVKDGMDGKGDNAIVVDTIHRDIPRATAEIKDKLIDEYGYTKGSRRISHK